MPDQSKEIARGVKRLVADGLAIWLGGEVLDRSDEERKKLEPEIEALAAVAKERSASPRRPKDSKADDIEEEEGLTATQIIKQGDFGSAYQRWYSEALRVVEQLMPDRYAEFREYYRLDKRPTHVNRTTYTISEYVQGTIYPGSGLDQKRARTVAMAKLKNQIDILASAEERLDSILADIEGSLEAMLLDDELATAAELLRAKHIRSAGVVAGVALERHLKSVAEHHKVKLGRKKPQIGSLNDALKEARVFDNPLWREVQRLGDIRNLCAHDGEREPKPKEVRELIVSAERIIKTVF